MGGAPPLLAMNGRGYTVLHVLCKWTGSRGGGTWQWGRQGGATRALQVDRLQRRRNLADGCRANVSAQARPSQWDSIRLVIIYAVSKLWGSSRPSYTNCHGWSPQTATPPPPPPPIPTPMPEPMFCAVLLACSSLHEPAAARCVQIYVHRTYNSRVHCSCFVLHQLPFHR